MKRKTQTQVDSKNVSNDGKNDRKNFKHRKQKHLVKQHEECKIENDKLTK